MDSNQGFSKPSEAQAGTGTGDTSQAPLVMQRDQPGAQQSDSEATFLSQTLSNRGVKISTFYYSNFQDYEAYQGDRYHTVLNSLGFLNLGISENRLCVDLMTERLCQNDMNYIEEPLLQYPDWRGHPFLRAEVAKFLSYYCGSPIRLNLRNVVLLNSCCAVFSALAMVLCDPEDAVLVPTPFHSGFLFSAQMYTQVELIPVHVGSEITNTNTQPFELMIGKLEQALLEAKTKNKKVKGLLLANPQNPLGEVNMKESLKEYLKFAKRNELHVIIDETYMLSVFDETIIFHSVLSLESLPDPNRTHVIWGSKDFGITGFRFGILYTHNDDVVSAMTPFGYLHSVSGITQYKLRRLLGDRDWINRVYLPINHSRLQEAYGYVIKRLHELEEQFGFKITFRSIGCGLYIWINLKRLLEPCTFEEELVLHRRFLDHKLILSRGKSYMFKEPGWFRLMFAEHSQRLREAMDRFGQAIEEQKQYWIQKMLEDEVTS
ncbi:probable inactive 1-aminocyclopropane-1-carboxylate synthase-like protein 2 [Heterocephalus glaber]|uniref:Probable inactive 1-aminocyclopropane-1-carboxylate synthase-like protein 2 n=1 Tax=Heterocephalus glaber TaxID=10181 RepID=A0AAX6TIR6_HETGA|nr:probable inactive 1-aminocyclopropane-1-carboxylate synthase-like protein 2 [Heterocephalus glaber]